MSDENCLEPDVENVHDYIMILSICVWKTMCAFKNTLEIHNPQPTQPHKLNNLGNLGSWLLVYNLILKALQG